MKKIILALTCTLTLQLANAQLCSTGSGKLSFFSSTPVEDIEAHSEKTISIINLEKRELAFKVFNSSFEFKNKLMQEHFNEKYMESEKYPTSSFAGKVNEAVDLTKDGEYKVTVTGKLNIHGVEKERTIPGTISIKSGEAHLKSDFKVLLKDHRIEVPTVVTKNIAEEINITLDSKLLPKK